MKKTVLLLCAAILLTGCAAQDALLERAMTLRAQMIAKNVSFDAEITADYGDLTYSFGMKCTADTAGNMTFTVTAPETIAGISGTVSATGGKLTFDDMALAFELMADGRMSPVSAPWLLVNSLRSGYLTACGQEGNNLQISIEDSYADDALHLEIGLDENDLPRSAEIYWQGRRLLSVSVSNFVME